MSEARIPGTVENNVLVGYDGLLFLAGGAHDVIEYATGKRRISEASYSAFEENIASRIRWTSDQGMKFLHVLIPDKQSIIPEKWPLGNPTSIASDCAARCFEKNLSLYYPLELLKSRRNIAISRVDTHLTAAGSILLVGDIISKITGEVQSTAVHDLLATLTIRREVSGDLGAKLCPPVKDIQELSSAQSCGRIVRNDLTGGNNGIVDIYLSHRPKYRSRVAVLGDSFGRDIAYFMHFWFEEVLFFRTPFFHPELVSQILPDIVITQNVERYLPNCRSDEERPSFFMYPYFKSATYQPSADFANVFSALLSVGRLPYVEFRRKEYGDPSSAIDPQGS